MNNSEEIKIIIATSDTHGDANALEKLILQHEKTMSLLIHLGDGEAEFFQLKKQFAHLNMAMVKGNCDLDLLNSLPEIKIFQINEYVKIFACHGHSFGVKHNVENLTAAAKLENANIALFGHTHNKFLETKNNLTLLNPGSLSRPRSFGPSFAKILVKGEKFSVQICDMAII